MRSLADDLSSRGIPALRFDYRGTGDSAGDDGANDQFETAVADVCAAVEQLKAETGVTHVTLCGLRLGTAFMLLAAAQCPVDELVLLAPVVSGRGYVRELSIMRNIWLDKLPAPLRAAQEQDAVFNVLGQVYSSAFSARLKAFDAVDVLKKGTCAKMARTLIFDANPANSEPLRQGFEALSGEVEIRPFDGYAAFMQESAFSKVPRLVLSVVADWIAAGKIRREPSPTVVPNADGDSDLMLRTADACEQPVRFGPSGLFGILCMPRETRDLGSVLLITNTSASAHVGDSRLSVRIAREMARRGIASLRFDGRGIGDSVVSGAAVAEAAIQPVYSTAVVEDTAIAAHWLKERGYRNVVSFGICSGAYSALRAALYGRALSGVISVNLQSFHMPDGVSMERLSRYQPNSMAGYRSSFFDRAKWKQVLRGERRILPFIHLVLKRAVTPLGTRSATWWRWMSGASGVEAMQADPRGILRTLQRKGVSTLFVCGAYDSSLDLMTMHFGRYGKRLSRFSSVRTIVLDEVDHSLFGSHAVDRVVALSAEFTLGLDARQTTVGKVTAIESPVGCRQSRVST